MKILNDLESDILEMVVIEEEVSQNSGSGSTSITYYTPGYRCVAIGFNHRTIFRVRT